jgi:ABC-type glycerol-3-phosphate transport system substrate-binding protein
MEMEKVKALIVVFIILVFFSCREKSQFNSAFQESKVENNSKIELTWLAQWYSQGEREKYIREIARDFMFLNQNIDIKLVFPHELANIDPTLSNSRYVIDTITKMIKNNVWPFDLMLCDGNIYNRIGDKLKNQEWGKECLVDFKDSAWFIESHKDNFFKNKNNLVAFKGMAPGVFIEGVYYILYASEVVEKKLGIKVKDYDMTMADLINYAKVVYNYNKSNTDKINFSYFPWDYATRLFNYVVLSGIENEFPKSTEESTNALKQAYNAFEELSKYLPVEKYTPINNERGLLQNSVLFYYHASWINDIWRKSNPIGEKAMRPCELPVLSNHTSSSYSGLYNCVFVVPKSAKNRAAAEKLMKFIASKESSDKWIQYSKSPTGLRVRFDETDFSKDVYAKFSQHIKHKYHDKLLQVKLENYLFNSEKKIQFQVEKVLKGEISGKEALASVLKQLKH